MEWDLYQLRKQGFRMELDRFFFNSLQFEEKWTSGRGYLEKKFAFAFRPYFLDENSFLKVLKEGLNSEIPEDPIPEGYEERFSSEPINMTTKDGKGILLELKNEIEKEEGMRIEKIFITYERRFLSIKNSKGMDVEGESEGITLGGAVIAEKGDEAQVNYDFFHFNTPNFNLKEIANSLKEPAKLLLKSEKPMTGTFHCILLNRIICALLETFLQFFTADALFKNRTILKEKEGQKIFSEILTIEENNPQFKEPFYLPFDGEGIRKERTFIVKDGRFENFLYNTIYGRVYGKKPAGSSKTNPTLPPSLTGSSIVIRGNNTPYERLIKEIGNGCIITEIIGGHTVNPTTGEMSVGASGIFIKGGERPFVGGVISGNFFEMLKKIDALGNDFRTINHITSPSILISEIKVGG